MTATPYEWRPNEERATWKPHGSNPNSIVLWWSVEEGPLAEIVCAGDVDRMEVAAVLNAARVVAERPDRATPLLTGIVMQTVNRDGDPWVAIHPDGDLPKGLLRREVVVLAAPTEDSDHE